MKSVVVKLVCLHFNKDSKLVDTSKWRKKGENKNEDSCKHAKIAFASLFS